MLFLLAFAIGTLIPTVASHGWMQDPVPRSGGGAGSGNASTRGPCGKAALDPNNPTANLQQGDTLKVGYSRVNAHGPSGNNVQLTLVMGNLNPTQADFNAAANTVNDLTRDGLGRMNTDTTAIQYHEVVLNPAETGLGTLQFRWNAQGSTWYDCATVKVDAPAPTACDAKPCPANAKCTPEGASYTCACEVGFFPDDDPKEQCTKLPEPTNAIMWITGETDQQQDPVTLAIGTLTEAGVDRVSFDRFEEGAAYFAVTAHPTLGHEGAEDLQKLRVLISENSPKLAATFKPLGLNVTAIQVEGVDSAPLNVGDPLPLSINAGVIAAVVIVTVALFGAFVFVFMRYRNNNSSMA